MLKRDLENSYWWTTEDWRDFILSIEPNITTKEELEEIIEEEMKGNSEYFKGYVQILCMLKLGI